MFASWGRLVYRQRRLVAVLSLLLASGAGILASGISDVLSSGGWIDRGSESYAVAQRLASDFGGGRSRVVVVYLGEPGTDAGSAAFQSDIKASGAAMIMVVVFAAFALADTITIKSIGVGMAIAVLLDATVIRVLLVPATMRLLGEWNWWAPGPLRRLADRVGFSHIDDDDAPEPSLDLGPLSSPTIGA